MAQPGTNGQQSCTAMTNAAVVEKKIIDRLVDEETMFDFSDNTHAWILTSSGTATTGYRQIKENLATNDIPAGNIQPYEYPATSAFTDFNKDPKGKAVVEVVSKPDGSGATINVYIESDTPTWSRNYDCNGNPVTTTKQKRVAAACPAPGSSAQSTTLGPTTPAPAGPTPTCSQQQEDPDQGIWSGYCVCTLSSTTKTGSLLSIPTTAMVTAACAYPTLPGVAIIPSASLGPATTMSAFCEVCTPLVNNEDSCTTITNCLPEVCIVPISLKFVLPNCKPYVLTFTGCTSHGTSRFLPRPRGHSNFLRSLHRRFQRARRLMSHCLANPKYDILYHGYRHNRGHPVQRWR